jgi:prepilin-type N-terminal cleavage/methylation domain-containing protein
MLKKVLQLPLRDNMKRRAGFTLLEILLVVATIAILAGIVILALNPAKQLADTRNAQREVDVRTILDAIYQYKIDNNGDDPVTFPVSATCDGTSTTNICLTSASSCTGFVDLSNLTNSELYVVTIPTDPQNGISGATDYHVVKSSSGDRITVCAPSAERSQTIKVTR